MEEYEFTTDWFSRNIDIWKRLFASRQAPSRVLEIGSYEGRSTVWIIENLLAERGGSLVAVDSWEEGPGGDQKGMKVVEERFDRNMAVAARRHPNVDIKKHKGRSPILLSRLLAQSATFDFVYVDGDHHAPNVLTDLVLAFHLCQIDGLIFCDDYLWQQHRGLVETPKLAIDAFTTCFHFKLRVISDWLYQLYLQKIAD